MGTPGGSRQDVYERFLRHFSIYATNAFTDDSMTRIFTNVLSTGLKVCLQNVRSYKVLLWIRKNKEVLTDANQEVGFEINREN